MWPENLCAWEEAHIRVLSDPVLLRVAISRRLKARGISPINYVDMRGFLRIPRTEYRLPERLYLDWTKQEPLQVPSMKVLQVENNETSETIKLLRVPNKSQVEDNETPETTSDSSDEGALSIDLPEETDDDDSLPFIKPTLEVTPDLDGMSFTFKCLYCGQPNPIERCVDGKLFCNVKCEFFTSHKKQ